MKSEISRSPSDQQEVNATKRAQKTKITDGQATSVTNYQDINVTPSDHNNEKHAIDNNRVDNIANRASSQIQSQTQPQSQKLETRTKSLGIENDLNTTSDAMSHVPVEDSDSSTRHLYSNVHFEPEELDTIEPPTFSIQDFKAVKEQGNEPFVATEDADLLQQAIDTIPPIQVAPKLTAIEEGIRQEPQLNGDPSLLNTHFSAIPDVAAEVDIEDQKQVAEESLPKKNVRGSKLGMGWFQGFSLFIALLVFVALAIFAYFMLGDKPLYDGEIPKYVLVGNEESGAMAALNPAIPEEIRKQYIYVPKVDRVENVALLQERPVLDQPTETKVTKVELTSSSDGAEDVIISEEEIATHDHNTNLELLSVDHNLVDSNGGLSTEDLALVDGFILQGDIAYQQGFYVGTHQDDAYYYYQSALAIDPYNTQALQGIANIANAYYINARNAYNYGNYDVAGQYVALGLAVQPDHSALLQLQQLIEQITAAQQHNRSVEPNYDSFNFNF